MKRKLLMALLSLCLCCSLFITNVSANEDITEYIVAFIENSEDVELHVKETRELYDIQLKPNYNLIVFEEGGYAISTDNGVISEYSVSGENNPYKDYLNTNNDLYYFGPGNYIVKNNGYYINTKNQFSIKAIYLDKIVEVVQKYSNHLDTAKILLQSILNKCNIDLTSINNLISTNQYIVSLASMFGASSSTKKVTDPLVDLAVKIPWKNINGFSYFSNNCNQNDWLNESGKRYANCCGPITAAMMLAYYQYYYPNIVNVSSLMARYASNNPGTLIEKIKSNTVLPTASVPSTLIGGINKTLSSYEKNKSGVQALYTYSTWSITKGKINNSRPVCVGLTTATNNIYGNHWVLAYGYGTYNGVNYYHCIDTWGNASVAIQVSWTCGLVYLNR